MDKLKKFFRGVVKYHFWILCVVVSLLTLGSWYMANATLTTEFADFKSKITSADSSVNAIIGTAEHPNDKYLRGMDDITNTAKAKLRDVWQKQYDDQSENLKWPVAKDGQKGLPEPLVNKVKDLRPIETSVKFDPASKTDNLNNNMKEQYVDFVNDVALPRLATIVGANWLPKGGTQGTDGVTSPMPRNAAQPSKDIMVDWLGSSQAELLDRRFNWKAIQNHPSTLQILYAQEDLWVLEALMQIIAKANSDSDAKYNAVVKEIRYVRLGADAVGWTGEVKRLVAAGAAGGDKPSVLNQPQTVTPNIPDGAANAAVVKDPAEGRYVDPTYKPLPPASLRSAFTSTSPADAPLALAKRMPVRMHVVVDQRRLSRLLAEFRNSKLVVELRQVRMNRPLAAIGATGGRGGSETAGTVRTGGANENRNIIVSDQDVELELYGLVYLYNPVNEAMVAPIGATTSPTVASNPVNK